MARRAKSARKLTLIAFFCVAVSTVYGAASDSAAQGQASAPDVNQAPLGGPATEGSKAGSEQAELDEAQKAYAKAVRIIRALSSLPPSQVTPYHGDTPPEPPAILKTLFPNDQGLIAKTIRAGYQIRHQQWFKFPAWLSRRFGGRTGRRREETRGRALKVIDLLEHAIELGHQDALYTLAEISLFPPPALPSNVSRAFHCYSRHADLTGNATSQTMLGFLYGTGYGGAVEIDQAQSLLHYTFAALSDQSQLAEMVVGYRYWAGIGVNEDCMTALTWYERAAEKAMAQFYDGPPGGRTLPPSTTRLSDLDGGVYGPGASVASTGSNSARSVVKAANSRAAGETWEDVLEYYQYHADRGEVDFSYRLGKIFYHGSVYAASGGAASGAEGVGWIGRDFYKARVYFVSITKLVWPTNNIKAPLVNKKEVDEHVGVTGAIAAGYLGRMYLRGEGVKKDAKIAKMWFERGAEYGDRESQQGLGLIYRDGLIDGKQDMTKAILYFTAAAGQDLAEAQVQLGKYHYEMGDIARATVFFQSALQHGSPFEAYYHIAEMHSNQAHDKTTPEIHRSGSCGYAVSFYKLVAERGSWKDDLMGDAERLWDISGLRSKGKIVSGTSGGTGQSSTDARVAGLAGGNGVSGAVRELEKEGAKLRWWIAAEAGSEVAQNNLAYLMDQDKSALRHTRFVPAPSNDTARLALTQWIRSAAQRNVDALVKVGDYYYHGVGVSGDESRETQLEKAFGYYQGAVETQVSALAMWNLGWMYEHGAGCAQDFHLAKRYYDMALETNSEAYFPVLLSLVKLYLRSFWYTFTGGTEKTLTLWGLPSDEASDDHWYLGRAKEEFKKRWSGNQGQLDNGNAGVDGKSDESGGYVDDDDPVQWARDRKREELERAQAEHDADGGFGPDDYFDSATSRPGSREGIERDDTLDDLIFMAVLFGILGVLIFMRTQYVARLEQQQPQRGQDEAAGRQ
ncbi:ERAD-associated protein [Tulasnella sp. JGI-2019a]|nr:ERAD-associated protein [Tulasnella sp. JGI-2019a]KAG9038277.1 ERAD-associated protein [Tulasnella sp. JGI-2019a]